MAEGKKIEIRIAATGGEQAAAEVRKVDAAMDGLQGGSTKAASGLQAMAQEAPKVSASSINMRSAISGVGYQVQDFAVQVGMGTSAVRAFSQQAPQLLSAFGPWGIMAGTAIALGAPLAASFMGSGKAAGDAADKVDALAAMMDDYEEAAKKAATARDVDALEKWFDGLDAEEEKIAAVNSQREKEVELLLKTRALKEGIDKARGDLARAEIEADPTLSAADKIRAQADLDEREKRAAADAKIQALVDAADKAEREAKAAADKALRQDADAKAAAEERAAVEGNNRRNQERGKIAEQEIPKLQEQLKEAEAGMARSIYAETGERTPMYGEFKSTADDLKKRIAALKQTVGDPTVNAATYAEQASKAAQKEKEQRDQADKARKEAAEAATNRDLARRALEEQQPLIEGEFGLRRDEIRIRAEQKLREQAARDEQQRQREAEREAKARAAAEARVGREAAGFVPKDARDKLANTIREVSAGLQDGDQGGEVDQLLELVKQMARIVQGNNKATDIQIQQLRSQIENLRKGGK